MARHARLVAPPALQSRDWPWHQIKSASVSSSLIRVGDRRIDAETYLSSGFAIRHAIERKVSGWRRFGDVATASVPPRLKATLVSKEFGVPYLNTSQVFDIRPTARKWLSLDKTPHSEKRFAKQGSILVMASANVGRALVTYAAHEDHLLSHHFMRVEANDSRLRGWLYAFLRSPQGLAMMSGSQYASVIRHIEPSHLKVLPIPDVDEDTAADFEKRVNRLLELRNQSYHHTLQAEQLFEQALGPIKVKDWGEQGFAVKATHLMRGRRRFEGAFMNPGVAAIHEHLRRSGQGVCALAALGLDVWLPTRFRRMPASDGIWFVDSADIFETNPDITKRIADGNFGDPYNGRVKAGWLLLARSGQTYGINGSTVLATVDMEGKVISDHVMRVAPRDDCKVRTGYLHTALSHPLLGRPLVKALAYGSSIPEIDVSDFAAFPVVRLDATTETAIATHAEAGAAARAEADVLERELARDAGQLIELFIAGGNLSSMKAATSPLKAVPKRTAVFAEHARVRLRESLPEHRLKAGISGTVVHVYGRGEGLEVEFGASGKSPKVVTLKSSAVEPLTD